MVEKINIVEILKDKPQGTKLYSSACVEKVDDKSFKISFYNSKFGFMNGGEGYLDKNGKLYDDGECIIFPSKEMHDWSKFTWKKGDVLINSCGFQCIFKEWASDDYTKFNGCYSNSRDGYEDVSNAGTANFVKLDNNTAYGYVREIERKLGGILNLETLEIEKTQPEFKDWDFITIKLSRGGSLIGVFKAEDDKKYYLHANLDSRGIITICEDSYCKKSTCIARLSTEEEKMHFFDALAKKGKTWDAEKKQIVDIKKEHQFKPFEKVLVRDSYNDMWRASFFSHIKEDEGRYVTTGLTWKFCIPYIGNESLVGTTKDVEG